MFKAVCCIFQSIDRNYFGYIRDLPTGFFFIKVRSYCAFDSVAVKQQILISNSAFIPHPTTSVTR
jgi:hypothetical protein